MLDPTYPLFPVFAFLGFTLVLVPLPWHLKAWNSGTCYYMMWAALACLNQFVNSVVWRDDVIVRAPVWCDISIRIIMAASVGIPASSLCINRRLYHIACVKSVSITRADKRRAVLVDSLICVLFPLVYVALQYIVQGHRFNLYEQIGCYPALYNTLPMYFISMMWPPLLGLVSAVYCFLSLRAFHRRRASLALLHTPLSAHTGLTPARYLRLTLLALISLLLTTPLSLFSLYLNLTTTPIGPWRSLADTHFAFSRVEQIPAILWRGNHQLVVALEFSRWAAPACAALFIAFFGFAEEARRQYVRAFWALVRPFGLQPKPLPTESKGSVSIGHYPTRKPQPKSADVASIAISLPAYSPRGTGAFTDLKRAESLASSAYTASSSRFYEHTEEYGDERYVVQERTGGLASPSSSSSHPHSPSYPSHDRLSNTDDANSHSNTNLHNTPALPPTWAADVEGAVSARLSASASDSNPHSDVESQRHAEAHQQPLPPRAFDAGHSARTLV